MVSVLENSATTRLGVANATGVVVGKAEDGNSVSYAVLIGDEACSLTDADVAGTGSKVDPTDIYPGETLHVDLNGNVVKDD